MLLHIFVLFLIFLHELNDKLDEILIQNYMINHVLMIHMLNEYFLHVYKLVQEEYMHLNMLLLDQLYDEEQF